MPTPPLPSDQRQVDVRHIKLLAIFHFVGAGLAVLGMLFLVAHYAIMHTIFTNPDLWKNQKQPMPMSPAEMLAIMKWFYVAGGVWMVISLGLNLASGLCLLKRKARIFSLIVAGVNCLHIPLGTVLGIFTIIVLMRNSVRELYDAS